MCGKTDLSEKSKINTVGQVKSLLDGGKIERSRYAHQIFLAALLNLSNEAFKTRNNRL